MPLWATSTSMGTIVEGSDPVRRPLRAVLCAHDAMRRRPKRNGGSGGSSAQSRDLTKPPQPLPAAAKRLHYAPARSAPARAPLGAPDTSGYSARVGVYAPRRRDIRLGRLPAELSAAPDHPCVWRDTYERALNIVVRAHIQTPKADRD